MSPSFDNDLLRDFVCHTFSFIINRDIFLSGLNRSQKNVLCKIYRLPHVVACETKLIALQFLKIIHIISIKHKIQNCVGSPKPKENMASSSTLIIAKLLKTFGDPQNGGGGISEFIHLQSVSKHSKRRKATS